MLHSDIYVSPVGLLEIEASDKGIVSLRLNKNGNYSAKKSDSPIIKLCKTQLDEYFADERTSFTVPLDISEHSDFLQEVWQALLRIPYGKTRTYKDIAKFIERPKAVRAVGKANGMNPIAIIIPCHRVIGTDGQLTGYAYGTEVKENLLRLENPKVYAKQALLF